MYKVGINILIPVRELSLADGSLPATEKDDEVRESNYT